MIEKKNLNRKVVKKMTWCALTPAIFQFTYKECKKKSKFGPTNLKYLHHIYIHDFRWSKVTRVAPAVVVMIDTGGI